MTTLVFQLYGALCFFSLAAFLILASVAKLRPDLDEEAFDIRTLEKLSSSEEFVNALPVADPIIKHSPRIGAAPSVQAEQASPGPSTVDPYAQASQT